jgi:hypothetical protein
MDEQLQDLIRQISRFEAGSPQGQKALNRLLILIQQLPGLYRSSHPDYPEAFNRTLEWVSQNLKSFVPRSPSVEKSLVIWINGYLRWRVRDLYASDRLYESLDRPLSNDEAESSTLGEQLTTTTLSLVELKIAELQEGKRQSQGRAIEKYIREDPEEQLANSHPKKYPKCNCQLLAIELLLEEPPNKISHISRELNISNQTLYSHWKKKCLPILQEIARSFGDNQ